MNIDSPHNHSRFGDFSEDEIMELFGDGEYRMRMGLKPGSIHDFFQPTSRWSDLLCEKRKILEQDPLRHFGILPQAKPVIDQLPTFGRKVGIFSAATCASAALCDNTEDRFLQLSRSCEPDLIIAQPGASGEMRMTAASVCFPSRWSPNISLGQTVETIHEAVPGLRQKMGGQVEHFLKNMKDGAWMRAGWSFVSSSDRNQHSALNLPPITQDTIGSEEAQMRIEKQAFMAIPDTDAVLFAIRVGHVPLAAFKQHSLLKLLINQLTTMPETTLRYKHLHNGVRDKLIESLQS